MKNKGPTLRQALLNEVESLHLEFMPDDDRLLDNPFDPISDMFASVTQEIEQYQNYKLERHEDDEGLNDFGWGYLYQRVQKLAVILSRLGMDDSAAMLEGFDVN